MQIQLHSLLATSSHHVLKEDRNNGSKTAFDYPFPFSCDAGWLSMVEAATPTNSSNLFVNWLPGPRGLIAPFRAVTMARQCRRRERFKPTNCFGYSPYCLVVLVQIRSCNQWCYNGGTLEDIWCSCKQGFSGFCCEKGDDIAVRSLELGNRLAQCYLTALRALKLCDLFA